jgi:hypothetical protein
MLQIYWRIQNIISLIKKKYRFYSILFEKYNYL